MNLENQLKIIERGSAEILTKEELIKKLQLGRPLNIKFGIDPTAPDIHLGHTVPLQKLKQFQDLGHNIQLIVGDYTAMIGDPSGRSETRPMLTTEQIQKNLQSYTTQVYKILSPEKINVLYNSNWLGKFSSTDFLKLASKYTVQQLLQRRDFNKRLNENKPLSVTELLYPLLVGYDSVHLESDIEIGGTDQLFNFMTSRAIQEAYGQAPEVIITLPLLEGIDGAKKMSKSLGNAIGINDEPFNTYGRLMSISDDLMVKYFELISDISIDKLENIKKAIEKGTENPMEYKQQLAREIVQKYHGLEAALGAEEKFNSIHRQRNLPTEIESVIITYSQFKDLEIIPLIKQSGRVKSNSEARRLIQQGGVKLNGEKINDLNYQVFPQEGAILQIGKNYFRQLYFKKE